MGAGRPWCSRPMAAARTVLPGPILTLSCADAYSPTSAVRCVIGPLERMGRTIAQ